MGSGFHIAPVDVAATCEIICYRTFWMKLSHHRKIIIVSDSGINLVPRWMRNYDSDMECESGVELDSEVNSGEKVNASEFEPFSVE